MHRYHLFLIGLSITLLILCISLAILTGPTFSTIITGIFFWLVPLMLGGHPAAAGAGPFSVKIPDKKDENRWKFLTSYNLGAAAALSSPLAILPLVLAFVFPPASAVYVGLIIAACACIGISALLAKLSYVIEPDIDLGVTYEKLHEHLKDVGMSTDILQEKKESLIKVSMWSQRQGSRVNRRNLSSQMFRVFKPSDTQDPERIRQAIDNLAKELGIPPGLN